MIRISNISKTFGRVRAVQNVSFEVARGQVVGLLGANGAGKTTTIRMIAGFTPPDSGTITVAGHDTLRNSEAARRCIGYLPEAAPAYGEMATQDYLDFRARLYGVPRRIRRSAIEAALERCELIEVRRRRVGQLSRGYRQRVGMAAAILHSPPVLILDEPTSALDPRQIRHIRELIRELAEDRAVLVSSHILPEVEQSCDRVIIMARGSVRVDARPTDLLHNLRSTAPYIVELRGSQQHARTSLCGVPGVTSITIEPAEAPLCLGHGTPSEPLCNDDAWVRLRISAAPEAPDLREPIAAAAAAAGLPLRELRRETPGLERVFLQLIEAEESAPTFSGRGSPAPADALEEVA
jgi:ABC-2 type transport system ATP-binding protein